MPPKDSDSIYGLGELAIQNPDGTFTPIGEADISLVELQPCETEPQIWSSDMKENSYEFTFEIPGPLPIDLQKIFGRLMLYDVIRLIRAFRRKGYRGGFHIELREQEWLQLRHASRLLGGMNPTRYIRSILPTAPARLFLVRLRSGYLVWRK